MIGTTGQGQDIYLFIEKDELDILKTQKIHGIYLNQDQQRTQGLIKITIANEICHQRMEQIVANRTKDNTQHDLTTLLEIFISERVYHNLTEKGKYEDHQGYRHINLFMTNNLQWLYQRMYEELKEQTEER